MFKRSKRTWLSPAFALAVVASSAGAPVPLLEAYAHHLGFGNGLATASFAVYVVGLIPALLSAPRLAHSFGQRTVVAAGVSLVAVAAFVFLGATETIVALFVGRLLQGVASGLTFGLATAWLHRVSAGAGEGAGPRRATAAMAAGFASGPLLAGLLAQWAPAPFVLIYVLLAAVSLLSAASVLGSPDESEFGDVGLRWTLAVHHGVISSLARSVVPLALWTFALPTIAIAALPALIPARPHAALALAGIQTGTTMFSGSLIQPFARRAPRHGSAAAFVAGFAGIAVLLIAIGQQSRLLAIPAGALLGVGYGLLSTSSLHRLHGLVASADLPAATGLLYIVAYVGFAAPLGVVILSKATSPTWALLVVGVLLALSAWLAHRRPPKPARLAAEPSGACD